MQTPPPFAPASLVQSPLRNRPSLASPLPAPNGLPPHPPIGQPFAPLPSSPPFGLQRSFSGHLMHQGMATTYDGHVPHANSLGPSGSALQSPIREHHNVMNGKASDVSSSDSRPQSKDVGIHTHPNRSSTDVTLQKPERSNNPMSFASILGPSNNEPSPKIAEVKQVPPPPVQLASPPAKKTMAQPKQTPEKPAVPKPSEPGSSQSFTNGDARSTSKAGHVQAPKKNAPPPQPRVKATVAEGDRIVTAINSIESTEFSDVENDGWTEEMERYKSRSRKRAVEIHDSELHKRKVSERLPDHVTN
jgi:chromatin-remodeling ATPase INO80